MWSTVLHTLLGLATLSVFTSSVGTVLHILLGLATLSVFALICRNICIVLARMFFKDVSIMYGHTEVNVRIAPT